MNKQERTRRYEQVRESLAPVTRAKDYALSELIKTANRMGKYRWILIAGIFILLFVYHFCFSLFVQLRMRDKLAKAVSFVLVAALILTSVDLSVLAASKDGTDNGQGTITEIRTLSEDILQQYVEVGAEESAIDFPESLKVTVSYEKEVEKATESDSVIEKIENDSETEKQTEDESAEDKTSDNEEATEQTDADKETSDTTEEQQATEVTENQPTTETSEPAGGENSEDESSTPDADEVTPSEPTETAENNAETIVSRVMDAIFPAMTVYAAEKEDVATPSDAQEESVTDGDKSGTEENTDSEPATKTVTEKRSVSVTWILNTEKSSADTFSSENAGEVFYYDAELSEEYNLADDVELPEIKVTIGTKSEEMAFNKSQTVDGVKVTVLADEGVFPEGATLSVSKVDASTEEKVTDNVDAAREDDVNVAKSYTFDIKVLDKDGNEIQPDTTKGQVKVSFALEEVKNDNLDVDVYHISDEILADDNKSAEKLESNVETVEGTEAVVAETTGFSYYTVEFTYNNLQYVMNGDSKIALSDILDYVGLTGTVTNATSSNPELFSVAEQDGAWMVTANQAFSSDEWLKVTIAGVEYEIKVTDDQITKVSSASDFGSTSSVTIHSKEYTCYKLTSGTYQLQKDVNVNYFVCPYGNGNSITIDLNGHTLSRNNSSAVDYGSIIVMYQNSTVTIKNGTLSGAYASDGGAINCASINNDAPNVNLSNVKIVNCKADFYDGSGGGAIYNGGGGTVTLTNCTISNCSARNYGGAISNGGKMTITDTLINGCSAPTGGGVENWGTMTIKGTSSITGNSATTIGGGVIHYSENGTLTISDTATITGNTGSNLYLDKDENNEYKFAISSGFTGKVGVTVANEPASSTHRQITENGSSNYQQSYVSNQVFSDKNTLAVGYESNHLYLYAHNHNWKYTATGNVVTATCATTSPAKCSYYSNGLKLTLTAPDMEYSNSVYNKASVANDITSVTGATASKVTYYTDEACTTKTDTADGAASEGGAPKNAGTYYVQVSIGGAKAQVSFTIQKAETDGLTAKTGLTYNGLEQVLAEKDTDGIVHYRIDNGEWTTGMPKQKDVKYTDGAVTGYKIEYYIEEGTNHKALGSEDAPKSFTVTIQPKTLTEAMVSLGWIKKNYDNGKDLVNTLTVKDGGTELVKDTDYTVSGSKLTQSEVKKYSITVTGQKNYTGEVTATWRINGLDFVYDGSDFVAEDYTGTYDGKAHGITVKPAEDKTFTDFEVTYSATEDGVYSKTSAANSKVNAGTYEVWYQVTAKGYNASTPKKAKITISPKEITLTQADITITGDGTFVYDGTAKTPDVVVKDGATVIPSSEYALSYANNTDASEDTTVEADQPTVTVKNNDAKTGGNYKILNTVAKTFTIKKAEATLSVDDVPAKCKDDAPFSLTVTATGDGTPTFTSNNETVVTVDTAGLVTIHAVGTANITVKMAATKNYKAAKDVTVKINIRKYASSYVTEPTEKTGLTYNGEGQTLLNNDGKTEHGRIKYATSANGPWSYSIPTGTDAGDYDIYYFIEGDAEHSDSAVAGPKTVTIDPKEITLTWTDTELTYNGKEQSPKAEMVGIFTADTKKVAVNVSGAKKDANEGGTPYTATAALTGDAAGNYKIASTTTNFNIAKKELDVLSVKLNDSNKVAGVEFKGLQNGELLTKETDYTVNDDITVSEGKVSNLTVTMQASALGKNYKLSKNPWNDLPIRGEIKVKPAETGVPAEVSMPDQDRLKEYVMNNIIPGTAMETALNSGTDFEIKLVINAIAEDNADPTFQSDKAKIIAKVADGSATIKYIDISLLLKQEGAADSSAMKITDTRAGNGITITLELGSILPPVAEGYTRSSVRLFVRHGNRDAEDVGGTYDAASGKYTFTTTEFSTYAVAYKDTKNSTPGEGGGGGGSTPDPGTGGGDGGSSDTPSDTTPDNTKPDNTKPDNTKPDNTTPDNKKPDNNTPSNNDTNPANTPEDKQNNPTVNPGNGTNTTPGKNPKTGDDFNPAIWLMVMLLGLVGVSGTYAKRRKEKGDKQ